MRRALVLLLLVACGSKPPGREFHDKFVAAPPDAFWLMLSKSSGAMMTGITQDRLEMARTREDARKKLAEEGGVSEPMEAEELSKRLYHRTFERGAYEGERAEGDKLIVVVKGGEWELLKEEGTWRLDWKATLQRKYLPK